MRTELFAIEKADVSIGRKKVFHELHMTIYCNEFLGVICSDPEEKYALLRVLTGDLVFTGGTIWFDHKKYTGKEFRQILPKTLTVISYKSRLIYSLSPAENMTMFQKNRSHFLINRQLNIKAAENCLKEFDITLDLNKTSKQLSSKERVIVELLQAYLRGHRAVVLTDPSEFISRADLVAVHSLLYKLKEKGFAVIIIDNPTSYLLKNTDYLQILRCGTDVGTFSSDMVNPARLKKYLLSKHTFDKAPGIANDDSFDRDGFPDDDEDLTEMAEAENLCTPELHHVSFSLFKGELLKLVCLDTHSRKAFYKLISGESSIYEGSLSIDGKIFIPKDIESSALEGIIWLPYAPYRHYLVQNLSAPDNLASEFSLKSGKKIIYPGHAASLRTFITTNTGIRDFDRPVREFSAFRRQELAYAKLLLQVPKLVFIEYPFSESTVEMKDLTLRLIESLKKKGICIILLTNSTEKFEEIDGDELYVKGGNCITEDEYYETLFEEGNGG